MNFIAIICGLKSEASAVRQAAGDLDIRIGVSGANATRAENIARQFCDDGARAVVSVGVSGGLDPSLKPGDMIIGDKVIAGDGSLYASDAYLMRALKGAVERAGATTGAVFGSDAIIDDAMSKAAIFNGHQCLAVDMESHGAARAAARAGVPFIAIRAIADPASRALPPAALGAVAEDGSTQVFKTLGAAMRDPIQFPALIKLGSDSAAATKTLRRHLGPLMRKVFRSLD